ncbi:MAG: hypothetical protein JWO11_4486 [Nocardioides sp.]|nr:hypothetical protein [Nocardioides sp.]
MTCTVGCLKPTPSQAHCSACHRTFGSVTGFDRHRRGGVCANPATLMPPSHVMHRDRNGVWRMAGPDPTARGWPRAATSGPPDDETGSVVGRDTPDDLEAGETISGGRA